MPEPPGADMRAELAGYGEVGRDLLAVEWAATAVGPPERWPQSLRTVVRIVLTSRFSMWMAWGEELTFFCNDAYRRDTLGTKYPWALGRSAREVWAEIWPDIGPRIETVMRTGVATWDEALLLFLERSGWPEETYHTFSYSPLTGDDGRITGMLCVVSEDTERVIGELRMATLRDLGADPSAVSSEAEALATVRRHLEANPHSLPFTLTYLFDEDGATARLATSTGIAEGHAAAPAVIRLADPDPEWPAAELLAGAGVVVGGLEERFEELPTGGWQAPPKDGLVVPIPHQGQARPFGFLVAGLNRYRPLDDSYRGFVNLVAGQIASKLASARAYETERARAETLAELDRAKTAFFTNVSHELRTPLTLLLGPAEDALADEDDPLPGAQRQRTEAMHRNAQRLLKLVNTLLDFSRMEAGTASARFEPLDLARYTAELASMFQSAVDRAELELTIDCPPLPEPVYADREMWAKIVLNLVSNALKFTFAGGITVRLATAGERVVLTVADTGIGIAPQEQARLFERFHRVGGARARTYEGSGIGLALVAELAALQGGEATVESTPGEGSRFTIALPLGSAHLPPDQVSEPGEETVSAARQAEAFLAEAQRWLDEPESDGGAPALDGRARVLVVDDNADMRDYIASLLSSGYAIETASDGAQALEKARADPPDLVLTDVMMPNLDGFGLLAALQADPATLSVPVVMVSARAGEDGTIEGLEAGADDYLVKPFSARELRARVRANLELDRARRMRDRLERSGALLDKAERLARVGSWDIDLVSGELTVSEELARQLGVTVDEILAQGVEATIEQRVHPDDGQRVREAVRAAAEHGTPVDLELRFVTPGGDVRTYRALGEVERDDDGRPLRIRGSNQDITEQRAAERALAAVAGEREASARERRIADELQRSLLPATTVETEHLEVATYYQPGVEGTQVGGDWYDVIELGAGRTALVIGDVMGRGVRAAAVMGQVRAAVRAYARLDLPPTDLLELLDGVVRDLETEQIVTCAYAVYDPRDRSLTFANAGHLPPLIAEPGTEPRRADGQLGPPLGSGPFTLTEERLTLAIGTRFALYTDGLVERRDRSLDAGIDLLAARLAGSRGPAAEVPGELLAALAAEGTEDDVAILVARVPDEHQPETASMPIPAEADMVPQTRRFVTATLARWEVPEGLVRDAVLLVSEMATNAIVHGQEPIELRLRRGSDDLLIEVDDGATSVPRRLRPTPEDEHGRGLLLVAMLSDRWGTRPLRSGKSVWCRLPFARYGARTPG
jgi:signal transduction histidine kinase/DNA-binding response OmpR family regulator/serine phosphatase RsbU (regulator of sigma subunit)/anti-sigma regulatory factor (Ser/Thr protein kinase)